MVEIIVYGICIIACILFFTKGIPFILGKIAYALGSLFGSDGFFGSFANILLFLLRIIFYIAVAAVVIFIVYNVFIA